MSRKSRLVQAQMLAFHVMIIIVSITLVTSVNVKLSFDKRRSRVEFKLCLGLVQISQHERTLIRWHCKCLSCLSSAGPVYTSLHMSLDILHDLALPVLIANSRFTSYTSMMCRSGQRVAHLTWTSFFHTPFPFSSSTLQVWSTLYFASVFT